MQPYSVKMLLSVVTTRDNNGNWFNLLNYHLFQKLKLIERCKFNYLINTLTLPHVWAQTPLLIGDVQHVKYLIDMGSK